MAWEEKNSLRWSWNCFGFFFSIKEMITDDHSKHGDTERAVTLKFLLWSKQADQQWVLTEVASINHGWTDRCDSVIYNSGSSVCYMFGIVFGSWLIRADLKPTLTPGRCLSINLKSEHWNAVRWKKKNEIDSNLKCTSLLTEHCDEVWVTY